MNLKNKSFHGLMANLDCSYPKSVEPIDFLLTDLTKQPDGSWQGNYYCGDFIQAKIELAIHDDLIIFYHQDVCFDGMPLQIEAPYAFILRMSELSCPLNAQGIAGRMTDPSKIISYNKHDRISFDNCVAIKEIPGRPSPDSCRLNLMSERQMYRNQGDFKRFFQEIYPLYFDQRKENLNISKNE